MAWMSIRGRSAFGNLSIAFMVLRFEALTELRGRGRPDQSRSIRRLPWAGNRDIMHWGQTIRIRSLGSDRMAGVTRPRQSMPSA